MQVDSHEKALQRGRADLVQLESRLDMSKELSVVDAAHRLYKLALEKHFTRGRRTAQVPRAARRRTGFPRGL